MPQAAIAIEPIGPFTATLRPPGSKSLTNRAMLLGALASGTTTLRDPLWADDTRQMVGALKTLGLRIEVADEGATLTIQGRDGKLFDGHESLDLSLGNAGTSYRFLTAALCLGSGTFHLDGIARMRQRPIGQLVDPLRRIGGDIAYVDKPGFPPLRITGTGLKGGPLDMPPTLSSQYISALLQVAPCCREGLALRFTGTVTSRPYVEMTLALMHAFGVEARVDPAFTTVAIAPGRYRAAEYRIEPDASNASYFLAAAAVVPGSKCTIEGLGFRSLQGDVHFAQVLQEMGASVVMGGDFITVMAPPRGEKLRGIDVDLNAMPDMAQTLAVAALFAHGPTVIRNVGNLRIKETDRLAALVAELTKLGGVAHIEGDDLHIAPPADGNIRPAAIDTYNDHRMAMSFAVAGLAAPGVVINDPGCVDKTFPDFFDYLGRLAHA